MGLRMQTDHGAVARKLLQLVRREYGLRTEVRVMRRRRLRKNQVYVVGVPHQEGLREVLREAGILTGESLLGDPLPQAVRARESCARAYLRGFFLGAGWVNHPEREYHLELAVPGAEVADALGQLLSGMGLAARVSPRRQGLVLYLKDGDQVGRFLALIGAQEMLLRYEEVRALREVRGRINREVNAETANLQKTVDAAGRQLEAIRRLAATGRLQELPWALQELALLRLQHPEASLRELGEMCTPPLSKSGVNHRMRQLLQLGREPEER
nr:MAG: DNA-binding protein WhiA [Bacillota bacterium]